MLFWCYVCPPLACLLMGRPFSSCLAAFLCMFFWIPGVAYAKTCYVDYKASRYMGDLTGAIRGKPERGRRRVLAEPEAPRLIDKACVGTLGTKFKRRK